MKKLTISGRKYSKWEIFRIALFTSAAWLAAFVVYKYTTQFHTISGVYTFLFPLSAFLSLAGIFLALKPKTACSCGGGLRIAIGLIAGAWLVTGLSCTGSLAVHIISSPVSGLFATFQMLVQHVFLSLSIIAFAAFPGRMLTYFGFNTIAEDRQEERSEQQITAS